MGFKSGLPNGRPKSKLSDSRRAMLLAEAAGELAGILDWLLEANLGGRVLGTDGFIGLRERYRAALRKVERAMEERL